MPELETIDTMIRRRVKELRNERNWSQRDLAYRMRKYGFPSWSQTTVAKAERTEGEARKITAEELVGLAFVFGVSPAALLVVMDTGAQTQISPNSVTSAAAMWQWIMGLQPMGGALPDDVFVMPADFPKHEALVQRYDEACPDFIRTAERRLPGLRRLVRTAANATSAAAMPDHLIESAYEGAATYLELLADDAAALAKRARLEAARLEAARLEAEGLEAAMAKQATPAPAPKRKGTK